MGNGAYQIMPPLTAEEYAALKVDIATHGVLVAVEMDESGHVLDGHHRVRACQELALTNYPSVVRVGLTEDQKLEHALTLNLVRRHLTKEQRRQVGLKLRQLGWSAARIAAQLGVSDQTVLNDLAATSKNLAVALPARIIGKDGKNRPARRPAVMAKSRSETRRALEALAVLPLAALPGKLLDVKRVERLGRMYQAEQRAQHRIGDVRQGQATLLFGDLRERGAEIADASVSLLFTDPPFAQAALPLWSDLSRLAARVLKPHGMLIAYSGAMFLPEVVRRLGEALHFWWLGSVVLAPGYHALVPARHIWHDTKPLLFYVRAGFRPGVWISDTVRSERAEKEYHDWQQNLATARYYIERLTQPGDVVCDPFLGGGTTGVAALQAGRQFIGFDRDPVAFAGACARLRECSTNGQARVG